MSVHKTPNGRWKVRWRDPSALGEDGKPVARSKAFDLKRDADEHDRKVKSALQRGEPIEDRRRPGATFNDLADEWRAAQRPILAEKTLRDYEGQLDNHLRPVIGQEVVARIDVARIYRLRSQVMAKAPTYTSARVLKLFRQVMTFGLVTGHIGPANPADIIRTHGFLPSQKRQGDIVPVLPPAVEAIRRALLARKSPLALRDATLVSVLAYAGLRPEEALALRWKHVDGDHIRVEYANVNGNPKSPTKTTQRRTVKPLPIELVQDLMAWRDACGDPSADALLFTNDAGRAFTKVDADNWRKRKWTPYAPAGTTPYSARHGHASLLIRSGWDVVRVARRMGHTPTTCLHHYAHDFEVFEDAETVDWLAVIASARNPQVSSECLDGTDLEVRTLPQNDESPVMTGLPADGRYWARTSDLLLVEQALSQLS
jgi:integrase